MTASVSLVRSDLVIIGAGTEGAVARLIATKPAKTVNYQLIINLIINSQTQCSITTILSTVTAQLI